MEMETEVIANASASTLSLLHQPTEDVQSLLNLFKNNYRTSGNNNDDGNNKIVINPDCLSLPIGIQAAQLSAREEENQLTVSDMLSIFVERKDSKKTKFQIFNDLLKEKSSKQEPLFDVLRQNKNLTIACFLSKCIRFDEHGNITIDDKISFEESVTNMTPDSRKHMIMKLGGAQVALPGGSKFRMKLLLMIVIAIRDGILDRLPMQMKDFTRSYCLVGMGCNLPNCCNVLHFAVMQQDVSTQTAVKNCIGKHLITMAPQNECIIINQCSCKDIPQTQNPSGRTCHKFADCRIKASSTLIKGDSIYGPRLLCKSSSLPTSPHGLDTSSAKINKTNLVAAGKMASGSGSHPSSSSSFRPINDEKESKVESKVASLDRNIKRLREMEEKEDDEDRKKKFQKKRHGLEEEMLDLM